MGGRRVGFGGGFKLLPGAEEARSNEAELEVEDFFLFFFFGCALEKKMFGVWTGFGARARRRFPARIWRRGARVGLVGGKKPTCGPRCQSVGLSRPNMSQKAQGFCRHEPARGPLMSVRRRRVLVCGWARGRRESRSVLCKPLAVAGWTF